MTYRILHPMVLAKFISSNLFKFFNSFPALFRPRPIQKFRIRNIMLYNFTYPKFIIKIMSIPIWVEFSGAYHAINHKIFISFHLIYPLSFFLV